MKALVEVSDWALNAAGSSRRELFAFWKDQGFEVRWATKYGFSYKMGVWGEVASAEVPHSSIDILCVRS
jgi:hypothetical protein